MKENLIDKLSNRLLEVESGCWEFIGGRKVGHKRSEVAKKFGVSHTAIYYIEIGRNWGWL